MVKTPEAPASLAASIDALDERLSQRFIALDPSGYFLIKLDTDAGELVLEHYGNTIDDKGLARDSDTGEVLSCKGGNGPRQPSMIYRGRSAKHVGIQLTEGDGPHPLSRLDHALYLGRELQKAEQCLREERIYVQD
ncbi:MAG: hypothetical protein CMN96_02745 [Synechococcus sp. MED850]|jgi:hypothetical protein|nr:hypothetical protein [Synechococcus sp. MED850]OUW98807.1 MAG: hypothetical protein CBD89_01555 [Cyanobacteria bacterium TMED229]